MIMAIFKPEEIDNAINILETLQSELEVFSADEIYDIIQDVIKILAQEDVSTF